MSGIENIRSESDSSGLTLEKGLVIGGLGAIAGILTGVAVYEYKKHKEKTSKPPETKKLRRQ